MSIRRTGKSGSQPPTPPTQTPRKPQKPETKTVISKDGFEGMVRTERRQSWRLGETDLHQAIDANASVTQVTNSATPEGFDDALDEFNQLLLDSLDH